MFVVNEVVIVDGLRTPFGRFGGILKDFSTIDLSALVISEVIKKSKITNDEIDAVTLGVCSQAEANEVIAPVIARQALIKSGINAKAISETIDKACCSGMAAVTNSYNLIRLGEINSSIAGGAEVMSRTPMVIRPLRWGSKFGDILVRDPLFGLGYEDFNLVSHDASDVAVQHGVMREEQDEWAYRSQRLWSEAFENNIFKDEIVPIELAKKNVPQNGFHTDEAPRPNTTLEKLTSLPLVFDSKTITAGNAPGLNDGAVALLLMSKEKSEMKNIEPLATIISTASVAVEPELIAEVPAVAINKALDKADLTIDDIDLIEINEAFAAVPLVSTKILGENEEEKITEIRNKTNVNGGAIAIGHPVGASGARILLTLIKELKRRGGGYGVASICGGLAQGEAIIVRVS